MSLTVTLTLDEETAAYLESIAADQDRTPDEVATWIVTEDLRHERMVDAELLSRLDDVTGATGRPARPQNSLVDAAKAVRASAWRSRRWRRRTGRPAARWAALVSGAGRLDSARPKVPRRASGSMGSA